MTKKDVAMVQRMAMHLGPLAGDEMRNKVMEGSEQITANSSEKELIDWVKGTMRRLDKLVDEKTRIQLMENCGYDCSSVNKGFIERGKARRRKYRTIDQFLEAEQRKPPRGTRLVREGKLLYQYYTPYAYAKSLRCYCSLLRGLPANEKVSLTYCHCSKGFVKKFWEAILERPLKVELLQSAVSGAKECKFAIHL